MNPLQKVRRQLAAFLFLTVLLALMAGRAGSRILFSDQPAVTPAPVEGKWLRSPSALDYSACFRKTIFLNAAPRQAWLRVAAQEGFEAVINGNTVDRLFLWRPTRPFQSGLSEPGQKLLQSIPLLSLNFPREYQWGSHRSWQFPMYMDITPFLVPGENSIGVMLETRKLPARFHLDGEIVQFTGDRIALESDASWRSQATADYRGLLNWGKPHYDDSAWAPAVETAAPAGPFYCLFDPAIYQQPFAGRWLSSAAPARDRDVWFSGDWALPANPRDAWLRLASNRPYDLFINGRRVDANNRGKTALDVGDWILGTQRAQDPADSPEMLDPDEIGSLEDSDRFLSPPHTDPTLSDFHPFQDTENRTRDHPYSAGDAGDVAKPERAAQQALPLSVYAPQMHPPAALQRDRARWEFNAVSIGSFLRPGVNKIKVRLLPSADVPPLDWAPRIALDGCATWRDRAPAFLATGSGWRAGSGDAASTGLAREIGTGLPQLQYQGFVCSQGDQLARTSLCIEIALLLIVGGAVLVVFRHGCLWPANSDAAELALTRQFLVRCTQAVLLPVAMLASACLVEAAWGEREESIWFSSSGAWLIVLIASFALLGAGVLARPSTATLPWMQRLPESLLWKFAVLWLLVLSFFLSAYKLDFHPIDDDEYASIEASLAIAAHGAPRYNEDVVYTRSPLYHYLDGASICLFGKNLWAMRLPSVLFSVATAWLTYYCGRKLLNSPWVGLGALVLYVLHPFLIYSAHIARFYQQQQFFALLTVYCFCRGFVSEQSMRFRYLTIAAFLCCVLSQELSLVIGLQLAVGYFLFARPKAWADEVRLMVVAACAIAFIALDLVIFQTVCLTHTEGVSPSVEATLHPQFANPLNFLSIFLAYSRLHLALSALFVLGLPFALKGTNRNLPALYFFVISGALFTNLLVTGDSLRYQYWLIPSWLLLAVHGPKALLLYLSGESSAQPDAHPGRAVWIQPMLSAILFSAALLSLSPWRILGAYDAKLLGDSTGAFQFVRAHRRPDDFVAATEPHPHGALLEAGRCDYDLSFPRLYDFIYLKDGRLLDRNAGAQSVSSVDELAAMLASHDRIWIVVNREKLRSRGQNIRWEYPGARAELFLRRNCSIQYQGYLWTVFLWDVHDGIYHAFRDHGSD